MSFAGKVWRLLVGIKDGLALLFLLLFFALLFAVLSARPSPVQVRAGALFLDLDGTIVEERSEIDPLEALLARSAPVNEYAERDIVRALDAASGDDRIKAVVLDLSRFLGGGQVHLQRIGEAIDRVRAAGKPVLTFAVGYGDDGLMLAAHASEVWLDPMGGAVILGPGGSRPYYGELLDRLKVNARVYRVGTYKAAVEPYLRKDMSSAARANIGALYGSLWEEWKANVTKARPAIQIDKITSDPVGWVDAAGGDLARAARDAGLVDKLGSRTEFGERVTQIAGEDEWSDKPGSFAKTRLEPYLADNPAPSSGKPIGVITIAGEIVDGDLGPGVAGGDRIADLLDDAQDDDLAALVVRIDSPGGSVLASEEIRRAILRFKAKKIPVAVSFANVAASGGYWVASAGDRIFAEPETITGSIGVFAVVPTFENTAAAIGVHSDGIRTTALSGQPDLLAGFPPEIDAILQSSVTNTYSRFLRLVAKSRKMETGEVDRIGQGQVWDGGTARQNGLVDQFGGLDEALEWAAKKAKLGKGEWHAKPLGTSYLRYDALIRQLVGPKRHDQAGNVDLFALAARRHEALSRAIADDLGRLAEIRSVQAYCLSCPLAARPSHGPRASHGQAEGWIAAIGALIGR